MNRKRAQIIVERLFNEELQRLAVNANLNRDYGCDTPACIKAAKERQELLEAMSVLFGDNSQLKLFEEYK